MQAPPKEPGVGHHLQEGCGSRWARAGGQAQALHEQRPDRPAQEMWAQAPVLLPARPPSALTPPVSKARPPLASAKTSSGPTKGS